MQTDTFPQSPLRADASTIECRNPATLERLGDVPALTRDEVMQRVARGRRAQGPWSETSFAERRRVMKKLLAYIVGHQAEICRLAARDSGKTMRDAIREVLPVVEKINWLIKHGEEALAPQSRSSGWLAHKAVRVEYSALGVVGAIASWRAPFQNIFFHVVPALFAGNAVVCKVSEWTSWSASDFQAMFDEVLTSCGHSTELVQIITGADETGSALVASGVEKLFFAGSPANGKKVMEAAAQTLTPIVLELGGKDAMIICDDADLDQAVESAMSGVFTACGQTGVAAERIYVMDGIYDRFVERVVDKARQLRQGPPSHDDEGKYDLGAMTIPRQLDIVAAQIADAVKKGARVLVGGKRNPVWKGRFFEPTILVECDHTMAITREVTLGPVMTIIRVATEQEAVRMANDSDYGLGASVFTKNLARGRRMARALSAGTTAVNAHGIENLVQDAPFGGLRNSGFGKVNGREGLRACAAEKTVVIDRFPIHFAPKTYPVTRGSYGFVEGAIGIIYGDARQKMAGVARVARTLSNQWQTARKISQATKEHLS